MLIYWLLFGFPALGWPMPRKVDAFLRAAAMVCAGAVLTLVIGTRDEIGCDWDQYISIFDHVSFLDLPSALRYTEPAYALLNRLIDALGGDIHWVNLICAAIFSTGLILYCRRQPLPWLALLVAIPYLVVVAAMGYTRQATAIGISMVALNAFVDRRPWLFLGLVAVAACFHTSAAAFASLALLVPLEPGKKSSLRRIAIIASRLVIALLMAVMVVSFFGTKGESYSNAYIGSGYEAHGDVYRLGLNAFAALLFFITRRRWIKMFEDGWLFTILSSAAVVNAILLPFSSVGADRMSLYLTPLQIAVFSRVPLFFAPAFRPVAAAAVIGAYAAVLYVWLNFAVHVFCWVPYRSVLW